jgi:regulator of sigma E protease
MSRHIKQGGHIKQALGALALAATALAAHAGERGYFGFAMSVDGEGFFLNPTIKSVKIDKVFPKSPAEGAGMAPGELIVEIEGHPVSGTKADVLKPYMERDAGQATHFVVKKPDGSLHALTVTPVPKSQLP